MDGVDERLCHLRNVLQSKLRVSSLSSSSTECRTELDSHADSPVLGKHASILFQTDKTISVAPFSDSLGILPEVPVAHGAVAYDCPYSGQTFILVINNALYIPEMECNLLPPIALRMHGLQVDECPKFLARRPTDSTHSITLSDPKLCLPLSLYGSISYLPTRRPTLHEIDTFEHLHLTARLPEWNPHCDSFASQEDSMLDHNGHTASNPADLFTKSLPYGEARNRHVRFVLYDI